jgi:glycosyltransferase involved in cell wall biosynthesis
MSVLMLHGSHSEGGGDTIYVHQLVSLLPHYGIDAHLISVEKNGDEFSIRMTSGTEKSATGVDSIERVKSFLTSFCDRHHIDLIHVHTLYFPEITRHCLEIRPVVKSPHSTDLVCPGTYKFFSKTEETCHIPFGTHCMVHAYTKRCCSRSPSKLYSLYHNVSSELKVFAARYKGIVVMSDYVKNECVIAGVDGGKVDVVPYFTLPVDRQTDVTQKRKLLYCGRLSQIKGVHTMIEASRPLFDKYGDLELDIIGDGPFKERLTKLVFELNLNDRVRFHGWLGRAEVNRALANSYLVLFPSIYPEAFGISGIEAMMHGKPVVGFDVGGVSTWLRDGVSGYLVPEKDVVQMRNRVEELINNETLAAKMGAAGREIALKDFSPDVHISKLKKVYQSALNS